MTESIVVKINDKSGRALENYMFISQVRTEEYFNLLKEIDVSGVSVCPD